MKRAGAIVVLFALLVVRSAHADERTDAKNYFKAGASAYAAGDYLAAIQALDAAYRLTPLPAIAFSLAQAERRQYFVSREPGHLVRAIELYRVYLKEVPAGGRRADATDALAQLEPLALGVSVATEPGGAPVLREAAKTRIMVTSEAIGARISLDGAASTPTPLIAEVQAGNHTVRVSAEGFFPSDRQVVAIAGELVPVEVELRERPAIVIVEPSIEAELYVDGSYAGRVRKGARIELASGSHEFAFVRDGRRIESQVIELERGETRRLTVELRWTGQRMAAVSLLVVSGVTLASGLGFTALAVDRERAADRILTRRKSAAVTASELSEYDEARSNREQARIGAIASFAVSAGSLVTGAFLYSLDQPSMSQVRTRPDIRPTKPKVDVQAAITPLPRGLGLFARATF
jgi:hypothetical protein